MVKLGLTTHDWLRHKQTKLRSAATLGNRLCGKSALNLIQHVGRAPAAGDRQSWGVDESSGSSVSTEQLCRPAPQDTAMLPLEESATMRRFQAQCSGRASPPPLTPPHSFRTQYSPAGSRADARDVSRAPTAFPAGHSDALWRRHGADAARSALLPVQGAHCVPGASLPRSRHCSQHRSGHCLQERAKPNAM